jgi:hypothetical protein
LRHEQTFSSLDNYQTQLLPAAVVDDVPAAIWRSWSSLWRASTWICRKLQKRAWSVSRSDRDIDRQVQLDETRLQQRHGEVIAQFNPCVGIARKSPELLEDNLASLPKRRACPA